MKKLFYLAAVMFGMATLSACNDTILNTDDPYEEPSNIEWDRDGYHGTPILTAYTKSLQSDIWKDGSGVWKIKDIDESRLTGKGFSYQNWEDHKSEADGYAGLIALCTPSESVLKKMSTRNLAISAFLFPYNANYFAFNCPLSGFFKTLDDSKLFQTLATRPSGPLEIMKIYEEIALKKDYGSYTPVLECKDYLKQDSKMFVSWLEMVLMTAVDEGLFSVEEIAKLAGLNYDKLAFQIAHPKSFSYIGSWMYSVMLASVIVYHYSEGLNDEEMNIARDFVSIEKSHPEYGSPSDAEMIVVSLSKMVGKNNPLK
ncbi:MAG: hypothetical protein MJY97_02640 [Bacteroidales bacterium]|nr:hypothetical protein [Bacteroidales bacterium]